MSQAIKAAGAAAALAVAPPVLTGRTTGRMTAVETPFSSTSVPVTIPDATSLPFWTANRRMRREPVNVPSASVEPLSGTVKPVDFPAAREDLSWFELLAAAGRAIVA